MKPGEADSFGTLKSLQARALGALRRRGRQGLARGQLSRAEVSEQARRPAEPRSGPGRVRRERLRQGIQVVTQRELHATPHHEFLRLPGSKLPGALCRGPGPAGGEADGLGTGCTHLPQAAGVSSADPAAHGGWPHSQVLGTETGRKTGTCQIHTHPRGPRLWGPWKVRPGSRPPGASL